MPQRTPRHLAEHRLPLRLMLVAFGLTFAVLAAMVASAALVPQERPAPSAVTAGDGDPQGEPAPTGPPPTPSASAVEPASSTTTTTPAGPPPGAAPTDPTEGPAAEGSAGTPPRATTPPEPTAPTRPPASSRPPPPTTTEPEPAPLSTVDPTTTTAEPTTTTLEPATTTTLEPATTTTSGLAPTTTTTLFGVVVPAGDRGQAAGVLLAPLLALLYLLRGQLPGAGGRHARPGRYRLPHVRSRPTTRRPPRRARTRP